MKRHLAAPAAWPRGKIRAAGVAVGLGTAVAVTWSVWAENPPAASGVIPPATAASPLIPQQSFAPLVKRVLPAVVNISVTEKAGSEAMSEQLPEQFRGSPFEDFLRRFFDQRGNGRQA